MIYLSHYLILTPEELWKYIDDVQATMLVDTHVPRNLSVEHPQEVRRGETRARVQSAEPKTTISPPNFLAEQAVKRVTESRVLDSCSQRVCMLFYILYQL